MKHTTARQYQILSDHMAVYRFMTEIYERDWKNGVPAPFWEYAQSSSWMDQSYTHRCRIWEDSGKIVGFCFYENPVTDVYFSLRPGYEELADEMVAYGAEHMPHLQGQPQRFVIFTGQTAIEQAAKRAGFQRVDGYVERIFDFENALDHLLPPGFRFSEPGKLDISKAEECCWKGFDHEETEGPWNGDAESGYHLAQAPHATPEYAVAVENENGEYVCYAGMWWTPENSLAYMEPLCTVPAYRGRGLAAAALSELYRRMKPLGATHMTGGGNPFYEKIGFQPGIGWNFWTKENNEIYER